MDTEKVLKLIFSKRGETPNLPITDKIRHYELMTLQRLRRDYGTYETIATGIDGIFNSILWYITETGIIPYGLAYGVLDEMGVKDKDLSHFLNLSTRLEHKTTETITQPNLTMLRQYIEAGIELIPMREYIDAKGNPQQCQLKLSMIDKGIPKGSPKDELVRVKTIEQLQYCIEKENIKRFLFIPRQAGLLCIDIDDHLENGKHTNAGYKIFHSFLQTHNLDLSLFDTPTYTLSPHGTHLYYKFSYTDGIKINTQIADEVEIKGGNTNLTAGGSVKNGKLYTLCGDLHNASPLPYQLYNYVRTFIEPKQPILQTNTVNRQYTNYSKGGRKMKPNYYHKTNRIDYKTMEIQALMQCIKDKTPQGTDPTHNYLLRLAGTIKGTLEKVERGGDIQYIKDFILQTPEHLTRQDQQDTITMLKSIGIE